LVLMIIDGLDASGKSTQARLLRNYLGKKGHTVLFRRHPSSDNYFGIKAREFLHLRGKGAHFAAACFYMLDVMRSILIYSWQKYDFTVFVRYLMGTAYLPSPLHRVAYHFFASIVPKSSFMFFLDVKPEEAYKRIQHTRNRREMFEDLKELRRIRRKALSLATLDNWIILDANRPIEEVRTRVVETLSQ
jgi:dTMP kinase